MHLLRFPSASIAPRDRNCDNTLCSYIRSACDVLLFVVVVVVNNNRLTITRRSLS